MGDFCTTIMKTSHEIRSYRTGPPSIHRSLTRRAELFQTLEGEQLHTNTF